MGNLKIDIDIPNYDVTLIIYSENDRKKNLFKVNDAIENGETPYQILEGCYYEYEITNGFYLEASEIVSQSKINKSTGRISPNIYVGTLSINVFKIGESEKSGEVKLEVQSVKADYRSDYRFMLEEITEKCVDLLLQHNSPASQYFEANFNADANTLYQRFAFIKSIIDTSEFNDSVHKIISSPVTKWKESETIKDIRNVRRINNSGLRQISNAVNRVDLPDAHSLKQIIASIPTRLKVNHKTEVIDTPENRFIKYVLSFFQTFCSDIKTNLKDGSKLKTEATLLEEKLEQYLNHSIFKEVFFPNTLPLNSPILQRKEGYREILRVWLMFDLAAKLVWHGGDDIYSGNKKDVAVLYEYWLFFKLLDLIKEVFKVDSISTDQLIEQTADGLGLKLKQGKYLPIKGVYVSDTRKLNVEFGYNRTFSGQNDYPNGGSWTRNLRPDYTLSIWPFGILQSQAEIEELIVHIHFDAKYKIENLQGIFDFDENLEDEKVEQKKGSYKRGDLLKMHTYRDAIRRTAGAYILYPGSEKYSRQGFHELLPGLGAFAVKPSKIDNGTEELSKFLKEVVHHFMNRASQREKISLKTYETYLDKPTSKNEVNEDLPEPHGINRSFIPDEVYVLVALYKNEEQLKWIVKNRLYNARTGTSGTSLPLSPKETGAKYLVLHTMGDKDTSKIFKLVGRGPKIYSKQNMVSKGYKNPSQELYLVYEIDTDVESELLGKKWDFRKLSNYETGRRSSMPFSASMSELMRTIVK